MYLAFVTALALSAWIIWASIGHSTFDGFLFAMVVVLIAASVRAMRRARDPQDG